MTVFAGIAYEEEALSGAVMWVASSPAQSFRGPQENLDAEQTDFVVPFVSPPLNLLLDRDPRRIGETDRRSLTR